jgi:Rod binding domain-containing protein
MEIPALQSRHMDLSNLPLENLAASTQANEKEKIGEVSRAFEAVLLRQILQEGLRPAFASKGAGNSATDGIYRDMVVNQLAENISKSGRIGLAKSLAGELQKQTGPAKSSALAHAHGFNKLPGSRYDSALSKASAQSRTGKKHLVSPKHE